MGRIAAASFWKTTLTFAVIGPPVGGLSLIGWLTYLSFTQTGSLDDRAVWLIAIGIFYGYVLGLLPAFITGALSSLASPALGSTSAWVATSATIGWLTTVLTLGAFGLLSDGASQFWNGLIGAIPAVLCAILSRKFRPRRP